MEIEHPKLIHETFEVGILLKGINGGLEILGGILLLFTRPETLNRFVVVLTQGELIKDPKDLIANFLLKSAQNFTGGGQLFGVLFLLSHGIVKVFLIVALYQKKLWAYPLAITVFGLFIAYQIYYYYFSHSAWLIVLSVLDVLVIWLTYMEYQRLKTI